jgi:hypothetical protein
MSRVYQPRTGAADCFRSGDYNRSIGSRRVAVPCFSMISLRDLVHSRALTTLRSRTSATGRIERHTRVERGLQGPFWTGQ